MKVDGHGQGAIISDTDYAKIRKQLSIKYRLLLDLARYTGERWGALVQLRVEDIFADGAPRSHIVFRASTRKAAPDGKRHTRTCPVHPELKELLERYSPPQEGYLFPSRSGGDRITLRAADYIFRGAVEAAGLGHRGFSTHSTRRTFVTRLYERGIDLHTIQQLTGHHDLKSLLRYVEANPDRLAKALSSL